MQITYVKLVLMITISIFTISCEEEEEEKKSGTLSYNGFTYTTVKIGTQEWTVENLRATTYNDGTTIPNISSNNEWSITTSGAYCAYENNQSKYGYLYNWYAVGTGRLAPLTGGWRVPSDSDWTKLIEFVGGDLYAGKLKAKTGWANNGNGTDDFGFSALPSGFRSHDGGDFDHFEFFGFFWSSTAFNTNSWYRVISFDHNLVMRYNNSKRNGYSVRLVRDVQ